jgi:hypothetical protein
VRILAFVRKCGRLRRQDSQGCEARAISDRQATECELIINLNTAKAFGLSNASAANLGPAMTLLLVR